MKKIIILFIFLPTLSFAEWTLVSNAESYKKFIDFDEILIIGDKRRVWIKTETTDSSVQWKSARAYQEFNCIEKTTKHLSAEIYSDTNLKGEQVAKKTFHDAEIIYVIPDSLDDGILDAACMIK